MTKNQANFRDELLRLPGQSVDEMLDRYDDDEVNPTVASLVFAIFLLGFVLLHAAYPIFDNTWPLVFILSAAIVYFTFRLRKARQTIRALVQGRDGERYVGQLLEKMRVDGHIIFHDVKAEHFNIDHVVIGPKGVYVIETKTWSKLPGKGKVSYRDGKFSVNGKIFATNPLEQAKKNSQWFYGLLKKSTGKTIPVVPVVVMPDWFIEPEDTKNARADGVLFVNPKALSAFIGRGSGALSPEDIHLASYHVEMHVKHAGRLFAK